MPISIADKFGAVCETAWESAEEHIEAAEKALEKDEERPSLSQARASAREAIERLGDRLVILIDDIDRLREREIRAIMQLVKAVADFPNTSFLLSFDATQVARALAEGGEIERGRRYLEKIVQLSVNIPPLDRQLVEKDIKQRLDLTLAHFKYSLKPYENEHLSSALKVVSSLAETPRDTVRWANHFSWALSILKSSVNVADLMVAEALRLKIAPENWAKIVSTTRPMFHEMDFITAPPNWLTWAKIKDQDRNELKSEMLSPLSLPQRSAVIFLFPNAENDRTVGDIYAQEHRRIQSPIIFSHYLKFGTGEMSITGEMVERWLEDPSELDRVLGNSNAEVSSNEIEIFDSIAGFLSFDLMPADYSQIAPLFRAIKRIGTINPVIKDRT